MSDFTITAHRGDTIDLQVTITRDSAPVNLTGADLWMTAKNRLRDADVAAVFQKSLGAGIVIVGAASAGVALVTIDPADTDSLTRETVLYCDVQLLESSGRVTTVASGTLTIELDATRTVA